MQVHVDIDLGLNGLDLKPVIDQASDDTFAPGAYGDALTNSGAVNYGDGQAFSFNEVNNLVDNDYLNSANFTVNDLGNGGGGGGGAGGVSVTGAPSAAVADALLAAGTFRHRN